MLLIWQVHLIKHHQSYAKKLKSKQSSTAMAKKLKLIQKQWEFR